MIKHFACKRGIHRFPLAAAIRRLLIFSRNIRNQTEISSTLLQFFGDR